MLNKNIYILFPPGYSGTYVSWLLSKSESDSANRTVDNPINLINDINFGGAGTSHYHHRIPTHHGLGAHLSWVLYNRPVDKKIYIINARVTGKDKGLGSEEVIYQIANYDQDPVFIHINDNNDADWRALANINCIMKWPVYFRSEQNIEKRFGFDCFNINNLETRNLFAKFRKIFFPYNPPIDYNFLLKKIRWKRTWFKIRNQYNAHEVNDETYCVPADVPKHVYQITLQDILSSSIFDHLETALNQSQCGDYDFSYARDFHKHYINAQSSLAWIDGIQYFRRTGKLTEYLKINPMAQSLVIEEMLPILTYSTESWKNLSTEDCVELYHSIKVSK